LDKRLHYGVREGPAMKSLLILFILFPTIFFPCQWMKKYVFDQYNIAITDLNAARFDDMIPVFTKEAEYWYLVGRSSAFWETMDDLLYPKSNRLKD